MNIIYEENACNPEYELIERTFRERLFSRPWDPRKKHKRVLKKINPQIYKISRNGCPTIIAHPSLKGQLENALKNNS